MKKFLLATSVLFSASTIAGGYVGGSVGMSDGSDGYDSDTSFAFTAGYEINQNFAVEASYVDLGEMSDDIAPVWTIGADGFNFSAVGKVPVSQSVELFGKAGLFVWDATLEEEGYGELASESGTDFSFGFGVSAEVMQNLNLVAEFQQFKIDDGDVNNYSIGAQYKF
ncbi:OmpA-like transmembrane region [Vibrio diabolicus E0666]|uniref:porin family protein n=1 Tax=Vibrio diabolicus TaxID=50719 RepID=UPI0002B70F88|nr:porin family protein [Vibrio diabolicus]EMD77074.1 OmpA-like transmembrane region [Vibrio diabolicus E0666]